MIRVPPGPVNVPQFVALDKPCGISGLSARSMHSWFDMWLDFIRDDDSPVISESGLLQQGDRVVHVSFTRFS